MFGVAPLGAFAYGAPYDFGGELLLDVIVTEQLRVSRSLATNAKWARTAAEGVAFLNPAPIFGYNYPVVVGDGFLTFDIAAIFKGYFREMSDTIRVTDSTAITRALATVLVDGFRLINTTEIARGVAALASDGIGISESLIAQYGLVVVERLRFADPHIVNWIANCDAADLVEFAEQLRQLFPVALAEELGVSVEQLAQTSIRLLERLRIAPQLQGTARFNVTVTQLVRLRENLGNFFGAEIADGVEFADALTTRKIAVATLAETLGIDAVLAPQFLLSVRVAEGVGIDDADVVNMLFSPTVREGVEISAGYVAPDGSFTAWAMNTRTAAVTEYRNFAFNSFARVGNRYLAASADGLFELLGDDDAGDDIIGRVRSGFMQFGGTQLSRLKSAYVAARGEGEMLLKIIDGDGREYLYSCDTRDMRSTKVHMGKGMRSRYFAFELVTTGQDFDIDTIEFVPIVVQRRV